MRATVNSLYYFFLVISSLKVLGVLLREKQQPEVADFMKLEKRWEGVIVKSKSQAEQLPLAYEIVEAVSAELAKRKE